MELSPENPRLVDPEIETSHAEEFVEELRWVADTLPRESISIRECRTRAG